MKLFWAIYRHRVGELSVETNVGHRVWDAVVWSKGAKVVGLVQPGPQERQPPLFGVPVQPFYHSANTRGRWICWINEASRVACQSGAQGCGFDSMRGRRLFFLQSHDNVCTLIMPILCLLCVITIVIEAVLLNW